MDRLETARLILRPREARDYDACVALDADPEVIRYVAKPWNNETEHLAFLRQRIAMRYPPGQGYWSIFAKDSPQDFLGWIMLCPCSVAGAEVEIGWRLNRAAWGKGYASEAAAPVLAQGFEKGDMREIVADIDPANTASLRVAEKIGLDFAGLVDYDGAPAHRYAITRAAFEAGRSTP